MLTFAACVNDTCCCAANRRWTSASTACLAPYPRPSAVRRSSAFCIFKATTSQVSRLRLCRPMRRIIVPSRLIGSSPRSLRASVIVSCTRHCTLSAAVSLMDVAQAQLIACDGRVNSVKPLYEARSRDSPSPAGAGTHARCVKSWTLLTVKCSRGVQAPSPSPSRCILPCKRLICRQMASRRYGHPAGHHAKHMSRNISLCDHVWAACGLRLLLTIFGINAKVKQFLRLLNQSVYIHELWPPLSLHTCADAARLVRHIAVSYHNVAAGQPQSGLQQLPGQSRGGQDECVPSANPRAARFMTCLQRCTEAGAPFS